MNYILLFIIIPKKIYTFIIMSTYIQNYGFTKTYIKGKHNKTQNEIKWIGDYDGNEANIELDINNNGNKELVSMQLDNTELMNILGIQPIEIPLEQRLTTDFFNNPYIPITLEGALKKRHKHRFFNRSKLTSKNKSKHKHKNRKYTHKV